MIYAHSQYDRYCNTYATIKYFNTYNTFYRRINNDIEEKFNYS